MLFKVILPLTHLTVKFQLIKKNLFDMYNGEQFKIYTI